MSSRLLRTQLSVDSCRQHLDTTETWGSEIESFLTQHILVIMCAEIQQEFYSVLELRANESSTSDSELTNFVLTTGKKVLRSIGKGEVAGFVGYFGDDAKRYLNDNVDEREVTLYNNAVSNRHDVAHSSGSNITLREIDDILQAAINFINLVEKAISPTRNAT